MTIKTLKEVAEECDKIAFIQKNFKTVGGVISVAGMIAFLFDEFLFLNDSSMFMFFFNVAL